MANKADKRNKKNIDNMFKFFKGNDKFLTSRHTSLMGMSPEATLSFIKMYSANATLIEHLQAYARRYKKACTEITKEDIEEVVKLLKVNQVLNG